MILPHRNNRNCNGYLLIRNDSTWNKIAWLCDNRAFSMRQSCESHRLPGRTLGPIVFSPASCSCLEPFGAFVHQFTMVLTKLILYICPNCISMELPNSALKSKHLSTVLDYMTSFDIKPITDFCRSLLKCTSLLTICQLATISYWTHPEYLISLAGFFFQAWGDLMSSAFILLDLSSFLNFRCCVIVYGAHNILCPQLKLANQCYYTRLWQRHKLPVLKWLSLMPVQLTDLVYSSKY